MRALTASSSPEDPIAQTTTRRFAGLVSALDQAWLSALSLAVSLAFIYFATKEQYGDYLLLLTPLFLIQGIQNALILSPVSTVLPSAPPAEQDLTYGTAVASLVAFAVIAGVGGGIGLAIYSWLAHGSASPLLVGAFGLAVAGVCAREGRRTLHFAGGDSTRALRSDLTYGLGLLLCCAGLCYFAALTPAAALLSTGMAALWTYAFALGRIRLLRIHGQVIRRFWACGRWALVGAVVTWINLSVYPLVVGITLGSAAVADLNVARLFLMPVGLAIAAWSNVFRPRLSSWMANGNPAEVQRVCVRAISFGLALHLGFLALLALVYPYAQLMLEPSYRGLLPLVLLWGGYFAFNMVRSILMATLMTDAQGYKIIQASSWVALLVSTSGLALLSHQGAPWVVVVLIAVELTQVAMIGSAAMRRWKK